ncbi:serine/threonine-protein kinase [Aquabacterium sp.]|uniref:serine/threonine-protein kinase n=1 Tax=Aquabacterium sp. TaxID=1872578 RepID=UPI0025C6498A|nr:serine/threonine-protein kinase [Aquabacterium sp.]
MSVERPSPAVTQPLDVELDRLADDDQDTVAETRPLPEPEPAERRRDRPDLLPSIGHIGRYALKYTIGEGGLGTVYAAHDPLLARLIAIKTLHVDLPLADREQFNALFLNEAKAAGSLNHPHIVTVYDAGTSEQGTYIAMELLKGKDLRQLLAMGWQPTPAQAALIVRRVADALSYAHHKGVIHRDIKPANIFMVGRTQPRVLDFGIARIRQAESLAQRDDAQSRFQEVVGGSPYYMAPEQVRHQPVDRRMDVWALGVVLFELLTFRRAFSGGSLEEIAEAVLDKPIPLAHEVNPEVPRALSDIVARAMQRDMAQRTRSARRLAAELRAWLEGQEGVGAAVGLPAGARAAMGAQPASLGGVRAGLGRPAAWGAVAFSVLVLGAAAWWLLRPGHAPSSLEMDQTLSERAAASGVASAAGPVPKVAAVSAPVPPLGGVQGASGPASVSAPVSAPVAEADVAPVEVRLAISPWGEVSVDGRPVGVTPPMNLLKLPPGRHTITIRNGDAPVFRQTLVLQPGRAASIQHRF